MPRGFAYEEQLEKINCYGSTLQNVENTLLILFASSPKNIYQLLKILIDYLKKNLKICYSTYGINNFVLSRYTKYSASCPHQSRSSLCPLR